MIGAVAPAGPFASLIDEGTFVRRAAATPCSVTHGRARIDAQSIAIGAIDGSLDANDASAIASVLEDALERKSSAVLWINSTDACVDEGLAAVGAMRYLLRAVLLAREHGLATIGVIDAQCFGAAALLAHCLGRRVFLEGACCALSHPNDRASAALSTQTQARAVPLLAGPCDARAGDNLRSVVSTMLAEHVAGSIWKAFESRHTTWRKEIETAGMVVAHTLRAAPIPLRRRLDALLPGGFVSVIGDGVLRGVTLVDGREASLTGVALGAHWSPANAWMLAESIMTSVRARPDRPVLVLCDGQGPLVDTEAGAVGCAPLMAHVARAVGYARAHQVDVYTLVLGETTDCVHAALAARATRTIALPAARMHLAAKRRSSAPMPVAASGDWVKAGAVDIVLESDSALASALRA